ncbi:MAG: sigma-70 family RNA polymerase sigma factor [Veillonellaceae bacterium]|jgi:RNA polymerase sigma factor (sigma-70 family)|nr:sigma-70 family RNA polymerase sigma factor [Veillonellaceae bacterium]
MELINLVSRAQAGDAEAFAEICRRFEGLVKRQAYKPHLRSLGDDALAEAWLAVVEAVKSYDYTTGVHFAGYVESKVKFALWNLFKREQRRWQHELLMTEGEDSDLPNAFRLDMLAGTTNIEQEVEMAELGQELHAAIALLPERQRQALLLTLFGDNKLAKAAGQLGVTAQAVFNLRQRALNRLKKQFAGMYLSERG